MLLRLLLRLIKPSDRQLKSRSKGKFLQLSIALYQFSLRQLLKSYQHYAISDSVFIDDGKIKIVHEYRDIEFESELIRNKIGFKIDKIKHSIPISIKKSKTRHNFKFFKFSDSLCIYADGKELFISHNVFCSIDGTIKGKVTASVCNNIIPQYVVEVLLSIGSAEMASSEPRVKSVKSRHGVFAKEMNVATVVHDKPKKTKVTPDGPKGENGFVEVNGVEVDTSFL